MPHLLALAVGVVPASRAGTASGAANSFLPLGTATGVAVFGVVLTQKVDATLSSAALGRSGIPSGSAGTLRELVTAGQFDALGAAVPLSARGPVLELARTAYTGALSTIFLTAGIAGLAVASLLLVREKDREDREEATGAGED